ncbi:MAG TPA: antirestriction protein ArdA [Frankiaceae bacterium]|nr:antirestriction protein ArdA [Frankiaceae bacterium]
MEQNNQGTDQSNYLLAPHRPALWVAPEGEHPLRGAWVDAARPAPLIRADIAAITLRSVPDRPSPWTIHAFRNFQRLDLAPSTPLPRLSRIARGIAKHGEAFARWVELAPRAHGRLSDFPDRYLGHFACQRAYVEFVMVETSRTRRLSADDQAQLCAKYALRFVARQWADSVLFADAEEGGVYAFSPE